MASKRGKKQGHSKRSQAEQKRRGRLIGFTVLGLLAVLVAFYAIDRTGATETIAGVVVDTTSYDHAGTDRQGTHTHVAAVLEYEGKTYTIQPADRYNVGDEVIVEVLRGRLTGYPYFIQAGLR